MQEKKIGKNTSLDALRKRGFVSKDEKKTEANASTSTPPKPEPAEAKTPPKTP